MRRALNCSGESSRIAGSTTGCRRAIIGRFIARCIRNMRINIKDMSH